MSDLNEKKELSEDEVVGEKLSQEYLKKVPLKQSAEVRMVMYVVPVALVLILIAFALSKIGY